MFHFDGYTRGNHPDDAAKATTRRPVRFFDKEREDLFGELEKYINDYRCMGEQERKANLKEGLYDVLMSTAGDLHEINCADRSTK